MNPDIIERALTPLLDEYWKQGTSGRPRIVFSERTFSQEAAPQLYNLNGNLASEEVIEFNLLTNQLYLVDDFSRIAK